jgi:DNA-binding NarL/FixJ family response regulator
MRAKEFGTLMPHTPSLSNLKIHPRRVLLVDDSALVRRDLRQLLELSGVVDVVGEAEGGQQGILLAAEFTPDVVLMDLEMPGMDGYEATRQIKSQFNAPRVVILSVHAMESEQEARAAGADAIIVKGVSYQTLLSTILSEDGEFESSEKGEES